MSGKRKRLTFKQRIAIIERLENGEIGSRLAIEYGVKYPVISRIKKQKENILATKRNLNELKITTVKKWCTGLESSVLENALDRWYVQERNLGHIVSELMLKEKALLFNTMLKGTTDFKASNDWLDKFKRQYSIRILPVIDKLLGTEVSSVEFAEKFAQYVAVNGINPDYIYNADETVFSWKTLPNEILKSHLETKSERPVTLIVCSNATGNHKIPLLVVENSEKLRSLDNLTAPPVIHRSRKYGWIDRELFIEWYRDIFLPAITKQHGTSVKCILLLDNASAHHPARTLNAMSTVCKVNYLPIHVSSRVQPVLNVIESMKNIYKKNFVHSLVLQDASQQVEHFLKSWTLSDSFHAIAHAWDSVSDLSIKNAWLYLLQSNETYRYDLLMDPYKCLHLLRQLPGGAKTTIEQTTEWLTQRETDPGWKVLNDRELLEIRVFGKTNEEKSDKHLVKTAKLVIDED